MHPHLGWMHLERRLSSQLCPMCRTPAARQGLLSKYTMTSENISKKKWSHTEGQKVLLLTSLELPQREQRVGLCFSHTCELESKNCFAWENCCWYRFTCARCYHTFQKMCMEDPQHPGPPGHKMFKAQIPKSCPPQAQVRARWHPSSSRFDIWSEMFTSEFRVWNNLPSPGTAFAVTCHLLGYQKLTSCLHVVGWAHVYTTSCSCQWTGQLYVHNRLLKSLCPPTILRKSTWSTQFEILRPSENSSIWSRFERKWKVSFVPIEVAQFVTTPKDLTTRSRCRFGMDEAKKAKSIVEGNQFVCSRWVLSRDAILCNTFEKNKAIEFGFSVCRKPLQILFVLFRGYAMHKKNIDGMSGVYLNSLLSNTVQKSTEQHSVMHSHGTKMTSFKVGMGGSREPWAQLVSEKTPPSNFFKLFRKWGPLTLSGICYW